MGTLTYLDLSEKKSLPSKTEKAVVKLLLIVCAHDQVIHSSSLIVHHVALVFLYNIEHPITLMRVHSLLAT